MQKCPECCQQTRDETVQKANNHLPTEMRINQIRYFPQFEVNVLATAQIIYAFVHIYRGFDFSFDAVVVGIDVKGVAIVIELYLVGVQFVAPQQ